MVDSNRYDEPFLYDGEEDTIISDSNKDRIDVMILETTKVNHL